MSYVTKPADPVAAAGRPPLAKMPALKPRTAVIPGGGTTDSLVIPARFCGPPGSGNGGYVCGSVASYLDGPVTVTLRRPPPLETALAVERDGGVRVLDGSTLIAEAAGAPIGAPLTIPGPVGMAEALAAAGGARYFAD